MIWLYSNHQKYLEEDVVVELMDPKNEKDKQSNEENKQTNLKEKCEELLLQIQPSQIGKHHRSPIKIERDDQITYSVIRDLMMTKQNYTNINKNVVQ